VTVLFSDLVGSTALAARLDPEDLRDVIAAYQKCATEVIRRFDGFVAKYLGDGSSPISVTRRPMRTMRNGPSAPGSTWSRQCPLLRRKPLRKPVSAPRRD
jgi:class 3 adenylate cyclase